MGCRAAVFAGGVVAACSGVMAQAPAFDWVTIGNPGNAPYMGTPGNPGEAQNNGMFGRGSVDYEYRITRTEVTHGQFLGFINLLAANPTSAVADFIRQTPGLNNDFPYLGYVQDSTYSGPGRRFRLGNAEAGNWPILGVSWRMAALYCNYLENGESSDINSIMNGAYDATTFTQNASFTTFTDQAAHTPGARFWIPTLDEWIKAAHYDPNRYGPEQPGYWLYPISRDTPPLPGYPQNGGEYFAGLAGSAWPVGMYPHITSPYGLLDLAGGAREWTETLSLGVPGEQAMGRYADGSSYTGGGSGIDRIDIGGAPSPWNYAYGFGFRLASSVPAPGSGILLMLAGIASLRRSRREPTSRTR